MATLDELLALLPDNNEGLIDAADLRTIVSGLWDQGALVEARVQALESATVPPGVPTVTGRWQINPQAGAVPGGQQVTCETGLFATSTWLRFATLDALGIDLTNALLTTTSMYAQQSSDAANWGQFTVTDEPSDHTSYVEVPVAYQRGQGNVASAGWQHTTVVLTVG